MNFSKVCVFLDNGHGSNTPGKCSPDKRIREYAYVREIVYKLNIQLQALGIKTFIVVPETINYLSPIVSIIPLQLLAYYVSKEKGLDVDKPRNLAKSVTVE